MKEKRIRTGFPWRSIVVSVLVILSFLGVILAYYTMLYSETREKIIKNGELSAVTSAEQIDKYLSHGIDTLMLSCCTINDMISSGKTQDEIRDYLVSQTSAIESSALYNTTGLYAYIDGEYLDGSNWTPDENYVPTERPWYIDAQACVGKVAVVDPYIDAQTHSFMITFSKTLCDVKSVAAMDFSIAPLQSITEEIAAQGTADMEIVLSRKYQVLAHSNASEVGKRYLSERGTFGNALVNQLRKSDENVFSVRHDGMEYIVYTVPVSNNWLCLSISNATSAFSQLRQTLLFTILAIALILLILLIILIRSNRKQTQFTRLSMHVVESLAAAIDAKDPYTNGHSGRVAEYAGEIGRRYGYSKKKQNEIYMMGLLHDVGKIGIPDAVINKPGKLTDEEFDVIKTHPVTGAYILSKTTEMPKLVVGARWHHERYDGTGYPDGLAGEAIAEEARIIAVADAYDAMTSCRSYRGALPQDFVRKEIRNGKGTQFDPVFADILLKMMDEDAEYRMHG